MIEIFDSSFSSLERAMRVATKNQEITAQNIANAKTPGYEPLEFDEELMRAVKRRDKKQVVLEEELASMTQNSIKYSTYIKLMTAKLTYLKSIASQGRR